MASGNFPQQGLRGAESTAPPRGASEAVLEAVASALPYLAYQYDKKDHSAILREIRLISGVDGLCLPPPHTNACPAYGQLQNKLARLNERASRPKGNGVYYTPADVVEFIVANSVKYAYGKLRPNNLQDMCLAGIPYRSFCLMKQVYDPTCGAGEFLLCSLGMKFSLMGKHRKNIRRQTVHRMVQTIAGNDIDPDAVIISKLRLFLCTLEKYGVSKAAGLSDVLNANFTTGDFVAGDPNIKIYDIVVGNPPYVEDAVFEGRPEERYGNIYGNILHNAALLLGAAGAMGFVVPLSYIATPRMKKLRDVLFERIKEQYILSYADRPDCLFPSVHQKLCILFGKKRKAAKKTVYTANYAYWYRAERESVFANAHTVKNMLVTDDYIPKVGTQADIDIYKKATGQKASILATLAGKGNPLYLNMRAAFWIKAFLGEHTGSEYKKFHCGSEGNRNYCLCVLNSSLFWWYWVCVSDCWHITQKELSGFTVPECKEYARAGRLARRLEDTLERTKAFVGTKQTDYEYRHKNCAEEIRAIDDFVNELYGLTARESLYIRQFAARYRMGGDAENEGN